MEIGNQTSLDWDYGSLVNVIKVTMFLISGVIMLMLNIAVIVAFVKYSSVRTPHNYFLVSVATADVLFGIITIPCHLLGEFEIFGKNEMACIVLNSPTLVIPCASLLSIICCNVERYIAVVHSLRYHALISTKNIILTIVLIWFYSILLGVLPVVGINNITARAALNSTLPFCTFLRVTPGKYVGFVTLGTYIPGMVVLGVVNVRVFIVAHHQRRTIQQQVRRIRDISPANSNRKLTAVQVLFILGHIFVLAHIPFLLALAIDYKYFTINLVELYVLTSCLVAMCPIAYPLVIAFGNRQIRYCIFQVCPKIHNRDQVTEFNTVPATHIDRIESIIP